MRKKEDAPDYRYLYEPNIPPLEIPKERIKAQIEQLPELPDARHARLRESYGLSVRDINVLTRVNAEDDATPPPERHAELVYCPNAVDFFEHLVRAGVAPQAAVNWTIHHLLKELNAAGVPFHASPIPPVVVAELISLVDQGTITAKTAHNLLREMVDTRTMPFDGTLQLRQRIDARGLAQLSSDADLRPICEEVVAELAKDVDAVRAGKSKAMMKLVGAVMRKSGGRADAVAATRLLERLVGTST